MNVTDDMVDAALDGLYADQDEGCRKLMRSLTGSRRDMRAALTAALAVSGYGEVVEALRQIRDGNFGDGATKALARAALSRVTPEPQS